MFNGCKSADNGSPTSHYIVRDVVQFVACGCLHYYAPSSYDMFLVAFVTRYLFFSSMDTESVHMAGILGHPTVLITNREAHPGNSP